MKTMKQLSKLQSALFLIGGLMMVIGAGCFAFGFVYPKLMMVTCWIFLLGTVLFSVIQAMQIYEGTNIVIKRLKKIQVFARRGCCVGAS